MSNDLKTNADFEPPSKLRVGIALIRRGGSFLVRRRPEGGPMAGYWEFPGGKCELDETPEAATIREAFEETGLAIRLVKLRATVEHEYPHASVVMSFFDADLLQLQDEPHPTSGFVWKTAGSLHDLTFPGANEPVLRSLRAEFHEPTAD